jgi:hypothetical protein
MKKIILLSVFLLSGCTLVDAYFMAKYDTNEYALINEVTVKSQLSQDDCKDYNVSKINAKSVYESSLSFSKFTMYIPRNEDATKMSQKLLLLTKGTKEYYDTHDKVSEFFCKSKFQQINKSAEEIQSVLARKPR